MLTATQSLVARLRSGHIRQITNQLGDVNGGRCCLGVACDIGVEYGVVAPPTERIIGDKIRLSYGGTSSYMPQEVIDLFGFHDEAGTYIDANNDYQSLQNDNDIRGLTFPQIADIIESRSKELFESLPYKGFTSFQTLHRSSSGRTVRSHRKQQLTGRGVQQ